MFDKKQKRVQSPDNPAQFRPGPYDDIGFERRKGLVAGALTGAAIGASTADSDDDLAGALVGAVIGGFFGSRKGSVRKQAEINAHYERLAKDQAARGQSVTEPASVFCQTCTPADDFHQTGKNHTVHFLPAG